MKNKQFYFYHCLKICLRVSLILKASLSMTFYWIRLYLELRFCIVLKFAKQSTREQYQTTVLIYMKNSISHKIKGTMQKSRISILNRWTVIIYTSDTYFRFFFRLRAGKVTRGWSTLNLWKNPSIRFHGNPDLNEITSTQTLALKYILIRNELPLIMFPSFIIYKFLALLYYRAILYKLQITQGLAH